MRRLALVPALIALALPLAAVSDYHGHSDYSNHGLSVSIDDWEDVRDCSALHVSYNDRTVPVVEENVPVSSMRSLKVRSDRNGSIRVVGKTIQTFHQRPFLTIESRDGHVDGWTTAFDKLEAYAATIAKEHSL